MPTQVQRTLTLTLSRPPRRPPLGRKLPRFELWFAATLVALIATAAALARMFTLGHGQPGFLVDAGSTYSNPAHLPAGVPVRPGGGYDGQFLYRLAVDPFNLHVHAPGIRLDNAFRLGRIGYPLIAWLLSAGGQPGLVPAALLAVGILALAGLGAIGAAQARTHGLAWAWGLLLCWPGLLFSIDFDLAEPLEVLLVVAGFLALQRGRTGWATASLSLAVLTRETALVAVLAIAVWRLPRLIRRRSGRLDIAWIVPVFVFAGWQLICRAVSGQLPLTSDANANSQAPFTGIVAAWSHWTRIAKRHPFEAGLHAVELTVMLVIIVAALVIAARRPPTLWGIATVLGTAFSCCLSVAVWSSSSELRMFADTYAFAALILLTSRPSRAVLSAWAVSLAGLATAVTVYWAQVA